MADLFLNHTFRLIGNAFHTCLFSYLDLMS